MAAVRSSYKPGGDTGDVFKGTIRMLERRGFNTNHFREKLDDPGFNSVYLKTKYYPWALQNPNSLQALIIGKSSGHPSLRMMMSHYFESDDRSKRVILFFAEKFNTKTISVDSIKFLSYLILNLGAAHPTDIIVVGKFNLAPQAKSSLREMQTPILNVQFFKDEDLLYDATDTVYGSEFDILSEEEKMEYLSENNLNLKGKSLPQMLTSDPVAKYMGLRVGTMVRLYRETFLETLMVSTDIFYRIVRDGSLEKIRKIKKKPKRQTLGLIT